MNKRIDILGRTIAPATQAWGLFLLLHLVGVAGLSSPGWRPLFLLLTPWQLALSGGLLIWSHGKWQQRELALAGFVIAGGIAFEVVGVKTGLIFGEYGYSDILGLKVLGVPLVIGLNWLVLFYCTGTLSRKLLDNRWLAAVVAATFMTLLDVIIEPVAIGLNWWHWGSVAPPLQNFIGWWLISLLFHSLAAGLRFPFRAPAALPLLASQVLFFNLMNLFLST